MPVLRPRLYYGHQWPVPRVAVIEAFYCTSLVICKLEYGYPAWAPMYRKDCELLERVQRQETKMVPSIKELSHEERLKALNLKSLLQTRMW